MLPIDHLVWGAPNLEWEIERFEDLTGVRAPIGGRHPDEGTHNALIRLGPAAYLELISPDPTLPPPPHPRWFGLDTLTQPRLVTWAAKATELDGRGEVRTGRRELNDGRILSWRLTYPRLHPGDGLVPFLIDWGTSPHPADSAPGGVQLVELRAEHPDPDAVRRPIRALGFELGVALGPAPALIATLSTPRGTIELR
ncbi:MAG TPA: VOC family protein [Gemmatimonadales bacterium]|nr:VOC family protein [Gemmatimonadales bacterium]